MIQRLLKLKKAYGHDHGKYITTSDFKNLAAGTFDARLKQALSNKDRS